MKPRLTILILLAAASAFSAVSCASSKDTVASGDTTVEDNILSRPFLDKPVRRPLGHVLIGWNAVEGANSYRVEMSQDRKFDSIDMTWAVSGTSMEIPIEEGDVFWIRVLAVNRETSSRWSPELEIREAKL